MKCSFSVLYVTVDDKRSYVLKYDIPLNNQCSANGVLLDDI